MENKISAQQLAEILQNHKLWLITKGEQGFKANLTEKYIRYRLSLIEASIAEVKSDNLTKANLSNLSGAELRGANFSIFSEINLCEANFSNADLYAANFSNTNLCGVNFTEAYLYGANFRGANLTGANFTRANLKLATFAESNLSDVVGLRLPAPNPELITQIAKIVLEDPSCIEQINQWFSKYQKMYTIAGWCSHLSGLHYETQESGAVVDDSMIASYVLGAEARSHFFDTNEQAIAWLRAKL
jgi:hypothetical protein